MLTLMASASNEVAYGVLSHAALIIDRAPGVFDDEYKQFFCKYSEPAGVKTLKMACLPKVANTVNAREIVAELTEYVSGVDAELARQAVRAIGAIAITVPPAAETVVESLLELVEMEAEYVRSQTVVVMQDLLRKYPDRAPSVIPSLHRTLKRMDTDSGKVRGGLGRGCILHRACRTHSWTHAHTHARHAFSLNLRPPSSGCWESLGT